MRFIKCLKTSCYICGIYDKTKFLKHNGTSDTTSVTIVTKKYRWKMSKDVFLHLFVFMIRVPNIHAPKFLGNLRWEYWSF